MNIDVAGHPIELEVEDEDVVTSVVVLAVVERIDDDTQGLIIGNSAGLNPFTQTGMLVNAADIVRQGATG